MNILFISSINLDPPVFEFAVDLSKPYTVISEQDT